MLTPPPSLRYSILPSPLGPMLAACDTEGALTKLSFDAVLPVTAIVDDGAFAELRAALERYFAKESVDFRTLKLAPVGSDYQQDVWAALKEIPHGGTLSYGDLAWRVGSNPRSVGQANGQNPIAIVIPCHRVIGSDGGLVGYAGGIDRKRKLLVLEGSRLL